ITYDQSLCSNRIPATPRPTRPQLRRFWVFIHIYLRRFSRYHCNWIGIPDDNQIAQLPSGLILKWFDPDTPHAPVSISMTRLPGEELGRVYDDQVHGAGKEFVHSKKAHQ
ncbi:hypothetical protein N7454_008194, partial [Penicillium verhagenii]